MSSLRKQVSSIISLLNRREKIQLLFLFFGAIILGVIEVLGVSSIMPFIAVASQPGLIESNEYLHKAYTLLQFSSEKMFLVALGFLMLLFVIIRNVYLGLFHYAQTRFTTMRRHSLSLKLFKTYISQKYPFFLNKNSYEFVKNIINEVQHMIDGALMQIVHILSYLFQILLLTAFLFFIDPFTTLIISVTLTFVYGLIFVLVKKEVRRLGKARFSLNTARMRVVNEAFWGIKETKITGCEQSFIQSFIAPSKQLSKNQLREEVIGVVPKYILEIVAISSILLFIIMTIIRSDDFTMVVSSISVYAYAGYRLMPSVQSLFRAFTKLKYSMPAADKIVEEFSSVQLDHDAITDTAERMTFRKEIRVSDVSFIYNNTVRKVLEQINLTIPANSLIGFAGKTGSGKTTLVDILLGLLVPQEGSIEIDGVPVTSANIRNWQQNLGYVPQSIYLSNDTIASNIAFGHTAETMDFKAVREAAKLAQIDDFIMEDLPAQYETRIGERGIRLSGGQRQRIGIARALYRNPSVLVMDEATSALDNQTEKDVMAAIDGLSGKKTIILIAHRLSTLKKCDQIFFLEKGEITRRGKYEELFADDK